MQGRKNNNNNEDNNNEDNNNTVVGIPLVTHWVAGSSLALGKSFKRRFEDLPSGWGSRELLGVPSRIIASSEGRVGCMTIQDNTMTP